MSAGKSRSSSWGRTTAALPARPTDRRPALVPGPGAAGHGVLQRVGHLVEVAGLQPALDAVGVDLDAEGHAVVHGDGQGLGAAHAAEAGGQGDGAGQRAAEAAAGDLGEALVGALEDPLGADVDPGAGGHLPVHGEAEVLEAPELVPGGPVGDQVGVGDEDPGRPLVRAHDADGLARLDEQGLVALQGGEGAADGVEGVPGAGRPAGAAVDDEVVGALGHLGVEVVHEHAQGGLLGPAPARQVGAPVGPHRSGSCHRRPPSPGAR